ncbi:MAG: helix-turn-helix domain-containing protein [Candidatus Acidiferrum sp.]
MPPKMYSTREAAKLIGISHQTLYDWIAGGHIAAPKPIGIGKATIRLWTRKDIDEARQFKGTLEPGRKKQK